MNVWRMICLDRAMAWTRTKHRIAIDWGRTGDITQYHSQAELEATIHELYPEKNNAHFGAPSLWAFCHELQIGDLVILAARNPHLLVVKITGNYEFIAGDSPLLGDYQNQRRVEITAIDGELLWHAAGKAPGQPVYRTLIKCARAIDLKQLNV